MNNLAHIIIFVIAHFFVSFGFYTWDNLKGSDLVKGYPLWWYAFIVLPLYEGGLWMLWLLGCGLWDLGTWLFHHVRL